MKRDNRCKCRSQVSAWGSIQAIQAIRGVPIYGDIRDVIRSVRSKTDPIAQRSKFRHQRHALILEARAQLRRDFATYQEARL